MLPILLQTCKKILIYVGYVCTALLCLCFLFALLFIRPLDRTPYQRTEFYAQTKQYWNRIFNKKKYIHTQGKIWLVGWAKENFTPSEPIEMTGYLNRQKNKFDCVQDSLFVRAFVFDNQEVEVAIVTLDLLIVPPSLVQIVQKKLENICFLPENVYFSATHTHSSIGGWGDNLVGYFFTGEYRPQLVVNLAQKVVQAIQKARQTKKKAKIGFQRLATAGIVCNRLVGYKGQTDSWLRLIKVEQEQGKTALLVSYAAHPTCLSEKITCLSGDYPSDMIAYIEKYTSIDMVAFLAGAMASQGTIRKNQQPDELHKQRIAKILAQKIIFHSNNIVLTDSIAQIQVIRLPLYLRSPHFRIAKNWVLSSWLFRQIYGEQRPFVQVLRLGNIVLLGMPCDFSGELVAQFESICKQKNIQLMITSFNGAYIGYITHDAWYDLPKYETYDMAWHGPENGAYFSELIRTILERIES